MVHSLSRTQTKPAQPQSKPPVAASLNTSQAASSKKDTQQSTPAKSIDQSFSFKASSQNTASPDTPSTEINTKPASSAKPLLRDKAWHAFKEGAWKSYRLLEETVNSLVAFGCRLALLSTFIFGKMPQFMYNFIERQTFYAPIKSCSLELLEDDALADKIIKYQIPLKNGGDKRIDISAWHIPAKPDSNKPTIVFSHGRHSNISNLKNYLRTFSDQGYGILVYDYPGFGSSTGNVSLENCYKSGLAVCQFLSNHIRIPLNDQILFGYSLGTHITSHMAKTIEQNDNNEFKGQKPRGIILLNSFPKLSDGFTHQKKRIAKNKLFSLLKEERALKILNYFFDRRKMRTDLNTQENLEKATSLNTLIISGTADKELDYKDAQRMAQTLKKSGHSNIAFEKMDGVGHNLKDQECQAMFQILSKHIKQWA